MAVCCKEMQIVQTNLTQSPESSNRGDPQQELSVARVVNRVADPMLEQPQLLRLLLSEEPGSEGAVNMFNLPPPSLAILSSWSVGQACPPHYEVST